MLNLPQELSYTPMFIRIGIIVGMTLIGLAIGWLLSANSAQFRRFAVPVIGLALAALVLTPWAILAWNAAIILAVAGFIIGFRYWRLGWFSGAFSPPTTFGSSRWATPEDVAENGVLGSNGIKLGSIFTEAGSEKISYGGDRHLLTIAPTRAGKGTTQIVPNLLTYQGSVLIIDPKGENAKITADRRKAMGQDVRIIDPWNIVGNDAIELSRFNPLDWLQVDDPDIGENSMLLADALVVGDNHSDSFWTEEAKALIQGVILYVATDPQEDGQRHLGRVRELLLLDGEMQQEFFKHMFKSPHHIVASTGARCLQKEQKLIANVMASAQAQTHFLDSARLQDNLRVSDFSFEDLKTKPTTIYLVLPADRLNTFGRWLRLLVQQAITINARNIDVLPPKPVLFILDEFAALGKLSMIEQAYGLMAGFGIQLWAVVQDLNQLERIYDKGWQSFIANAGMINYFGSSDKTTSEYFSSMCGETTVWNFSSALSHAFGSSNNSVNTTDTNSDTRAASQRKLIYPDELMRLKPGQQLILIENMHPLMAQKIRWFDDPKLSGLGKNLHDSAKTNTADHMQG